MSTSAVQYQRSARKTPVSFSFRMTVRTFLECFFFPSRDKKSAMDPERVIASIVALLFLIIALRKVQNFFRVEDCGRDAENRYHSRPQRPRSFWSRFLAQTRRIAASGDENESLPKGFS